MSIITDSTFLESAIQLGFEPQLFFILLNASSNIIGRLTPLEKKAILKYYNKYQPKKILFAMGDGVNDVQMFQQADISVGIAGAEGEYACANADMSVPALKYLPQLFRHGCQQHYGTVIMINYVIYKCGIIVFVNLLYNIFVC